MDMAPNRASESLENGLEQASTFQGFSALVPSLQVGRLPPERQEELLRPSATDVQL